MPWSLNFLGKSIDYLAIRDRIKALWKLYSGFELMDMRNSFFLVKFDLEDD